MQARRVLTDNGSCYLSTDFARSCRSLGLKHPRTKPCTPRTKGKAQQFIQTLLREWTYAKPYRHAAQRTGALLPYLRRYNHQHPHAPLGYRPPISRLDRRE